MWNTRKPKANQHIQLMYLHTTNEKSFPEGWKKLDGRARQTFTSGKPLDKGKVHFNHFCIDTFGYAQKRAFCSKSKSRNNFVAPYSNQVL